MVLLAMVPLVLRIEQRFPFRFARWRRSLLAHAVATVPFSLLHVGAMVLLRKLAYAATGCHYDFGNTGRQLVYEYLKDCAPTPTSWPFPMSTASSCCNCKARPAC